MNSMQIVRLLIVVCSLFSCGQAVTPSRPPWSPPPGMAFSTLHGIWRVDCRFRVVQHLHGQMAPDVFDSRGNLYRHTWLRIEQIGPTEFRFGIGGMPGEGHAGGVFWLALAASNGSISGSEQLVFDNPSNRVDLVSATGTYTERALNLVSLWHVEYHEFESGYIERGTCTATRDHDW